MEEIAPSQVPSFGDLSDTSYLGKKCNGNEGNGRERVSRRR